VPRPRYRTRSLRKIKVRTPGGKLVTHYEKRHKSWYKCALCGKPLAGVPREPKKFPKSSRRPERPYGGYLCAECLRRELTLAVIKLYAPNIRKNLPGV